MITSKDDNTTASLLGFAIANRVDPPNCKSDGNIDEVLSGKHQDKLASKRGDDDNKNKKEKNAN